VEFPERYPFYEHLPESLRLISDMSSNIATRQIDWDSLDYVYAGL
jgi:phosphoserine aminotransferase